MDWPNRIPAVLRRHAPLVVTLGLTLVLAQTLAGLSWQWLTPATAPRNSAPVESAGTTSGETPQQKAERIATAHLFGEAPRPATGASGATPRVHVNLTLHGVLSQSPGDTGIAILSAPGTPEKSYKVGDTLPGGGILRAVEPRRVRIEANGGEAVLELPKAVLSQASRASLAPATPNAPGVAAATPALARDRILEKPAELLKMVRTEPYTEEGRIKGFRLQPGGDPALFYSLGFAPGDVVLRINDQSATDTATLGRLMQELRTAQAVNITVLRDGQEIPLLIQLN